MIPRPKKLPCLVREDSPLTRTWLRYLRWDRQEKDEIGAVLRRCCPMGLFFEAGSDCPTSLHDTKLHCAIEKEIGVDYEDESWAGAADEAVAAFGDWWDSLTDAQAAVDAVWPLDDCEQCQGSGLDNAKELVKSHDLH